MNEHVIVMNCVSVLRREKMQGLERLLVELTVKSGRNVDGFATISLQNHWVHRFAKNQIERGRFGSVESIDLVPQTKFGRSHFQGSGHMDPDS